MLTLYFYLAVKNKVVYLHDSHVIDIVALPSLSIQILLVHMMLQAKEFINILYVMFNKLFTSFFVSGFHSTVWCMNQLNNKMLSV